MGSVQNIVSIESPEGRVPEQGRAPDFFIVGHPKCGTSALYLILRRHPQIYMPDIKEPRFFAAELRSRFRQPALDKRPETLDGYRALFAAAGPEQRIGEASPIYLMSHAAAGRIAEAQPDARIIAILREPASFLRSFHLQCVHNHIETQTDLRKAIALEGARREGKRIPRYSHSPQMLMYSELVRYVEQLRRYHAVFPPEQVLVLVYDDFRRDNEATARKVLRFLAVDESHVAPVETDPLAGVRFQRLHHLTRMAAVASRNPAAAGPVARGVNALISERLRSDATRARWRRLVYREPPPPDRQLMLELRRRFKGEVVALSDYLGRDLVTQWGYDSVS
ncbi:MAG: sulfotransferase family protein [Solirubrobacteraceae bacterium]